MTATQAGGEPGARRVVVTGAAGFIGSALASRLAAAGDAALVLTDRHAPAPRPGGTSVAGDIGDAALVARLFERPVHALHHLAGVVSGAADADFALGKRVNLDATIALLERCRAQAASGGPVVRLVYASSIAVYGVPLPGRIDDATAAQPTLSYGTHKRACELLIDDYTRRGWVDGRALRLPGVVMRPPLPNGALSAFNSDLLREPLAGRDYHCPVGPEATVWVASLAHVLENWLRIARMPAEALGPVRELTAPALAVQVRELVAAMERRRAGAAAHVRYPERADASLVAQFGAWPLEARFERATRLGLTADRDADALVDAILAPSAREHA